MEKSKKIKLSNISKSQLEKEQLAYLRGGISDESAETCGVKCEREGCIGAKNYIQVGQTLKS